MSYIDLFLDTSRPLATPRFRCDDEHWRELGLIFPETGFRSYFIGYLITKLRKELKENGINSYTDRLSDPRFSDIARFMSDIEFTRHKSKPDDGRGSGCACNEDKSSAGDAGNHASTPSCRNKEEESDKDGEEAGPINT